MQHIDTVTPRQPRLTILRRPAVEAETGEGRSTLYERMAQGLFPRPVKMTGSRSVGWPASEVDAVNAARISGATEDEMRCLVARLMAARKSLQ